MKKLLLLSVLFQVVFLGAARASAPQIKTPEPGYYRFMVGTIEVTALSDGTFPMKVDDLLQGVKPDEVNRLLAKDYESANVVTSVNGFLINTGTKLVLIDTGTGGMMGPTVGKLMENLKASGYKPEQVDEIYVTHMHGDHVGGLSKDGKRNFRNAIVRADQHDADFWMNDAEAAKATNPMMKRNFETAKAMLGPYASSGKFKSFNGDTEMVPGIFAHAAYGHTPGHTVYTIESGGKKLWLLGDMIHVAAVQFPKPGATMKFDSDSQKASAVRAKDFAQAASAGDMIAAAHLSFPGVGHIRKDKGGYDFTPLAYGSAWQ